MTLSALSVAQTFIVRADRVVRPYTRLPMTPCTIGRGVEDAAPYKCLPIPLCMIVWDAPRVPQQRLRRQNHFFRLKYQTNPATTSAETATTTG